MSEKKAKYGSSFALDENTFALENGEFTGWNTKSTGDGTAYADKADFTLESNTTLYAQWNKKGNPTPPVPPTTHQITYKLNGGTYNGNPDDIVETHKVGDTIKVHAAPDARPGYTFAYWEGSRYNPGDDFVVKENHTFTAVWIKDTPKKDDNSDDDSDDDSGSEDSSKKGGAKTGDYTNIWIWIALITSSLGATYVIRSSRRRE